MLRRSGLGRISKVTQRVKELVDQQTEDDDETTDIPLVASLLVASLSLNDSGAGLLAASADVPTVKGSF